MSHAREIEKRGSRKRTILKAVGGDYLIVVTRRFFGRSGRRVDRVLEPGPAAKRHLDRVHQSSPSSGGKKKKKAEGCSRTCTCVYARVRLFSAKKNRENQREDAALLPISPDIFPTRRRTPGGRIRPSSRVCVICDDAVTPCDRATSTTATVTMTTTTTTISFQARSVHPESRSQQSTHKHAQPFTTERSSCENTATKTFLVSQGVIDGGKKIPRLTDFS